MGWRLAEGIVSESILNQVLGQRARCDEGCRLDDRRMDPQRHENESPLWVRNGPSATPPGRSAPGGEADEIGAKADIGLERRLSE